MVTEETCTIVYYDGIYHAERIAKRSGERPTATVFEGTLTVADMDQMLRIVNSKDFIALKSPAPQTHRLVLEDFHLIAVSVPRDSGMQDLQYPNADSRKGTEKTLGPLLGWWKNVWKHLPPALRTGTSNRCLPRSGPPADGRTTQ